MTYHTVLHYFIPNNSSISILNYIQIIFIVVLLVGHLKQERQGHLIHTKTIDTAFFELLKATWNEWVASMMAMLVFCGRSVRYENLRYKNYKFGEF